MNKTRCRAWRVVPVALLVWGMACPPSDRDRYGFSLQDGKLRLGPRDFVLRAVESPRLSDPELPLEEKIRALNKICAVGGNGVVVGIQGSTPTEPIGEGWLSAFHALANETQKRRMALVLRFPDPDRFPGAEPRLELVRTVARRLGDRWDVLYWIQGPDGPRLAEEFRSLTDQVVISPGKGDIIPVENLPPGATSGPLLLVGSLPPPQHAQVHCILPDGEVSYRALEEASLQEAERLPWTSDPEALDSREGEEGFIALFNGRNFDGWTIEGNPQGWEIREQAIHRVGRGGNVRTRDRYDDFILRLEWKIEENGNSGVFLRAPRAGRESRVGMELQLMGDHGRAPHKNGTGAIYDVLAPQVNASRPAGEWNQLEVLCQGPHFRATLNGVLIQDVNLDEHPELRPRLRKGFIALQDHGDYVAFRNIRLKPLAAPPWETTEAGGPRESE